VIKKRCELICTLLTIVLFLGGCASQPKIEKYFVGDSLELAEPVAILPFVWADEVKQEDRERLSDLPGQVHQVFVGSFASLPYEDVSDVETRLADARLLDGAAWRTTEFSELASKIEAGTLVRGEVTKGALGTGGLVSKTAVGFKVAFIDGKTGTLLWQGTSESSRRGGVLFHAGQATELVSELSSDESEAQRLLRTVTEDAVRKLVLSIPPPAQMDVTVPAITSRLVKISTQGETDQKQIDVSLQGTPSCRASFDIGTFRRYVPMWEIQPGRYEGNYIAQPGDRVNSVPVIVRLESRLGVMTQQTVEEKQVTLP